MSIVTVLSLTDCLFGIYSTLLYNILISSFYLLLNAHHKYLLVEWLLRDKHKWTALRSNVQCMYFTLVFFFQIIWQFTEPNLTASNQKGFLAWQVSNISSIILFNIYCLFWPNECQSNWYFIITILMAEASLMRLKSPNINNSLLRSLLGNPCLLCSCYLGRHATLLPLMVAHLSFLFLSLKLTNKEQASIF